MAPWERPAAARATMDKPLTNAFSWSISARDDFEECRRRRFWSKYAMWGGWNAAAPAQARDAYRLGKMQNCFSLQGAALERAVLWALRRIQAGDPVTADDAYAEAARPFLNAAWRESKTGRWRDSPKRCCCLHEHYYPDHHTTPEPERIQRMIATVQRGLTHAVARVLPALAAVRPEQEVAIHQAGGGDPESFLLDGLKVYAIPDYAYRDGDTLHIHDWKSGQIRPSHRDQMAVYGLWAHTVHGQAPGAIRVHLEYLPHETTASDTATAAGLEQARAMIRQSAADMAAYLVNGDARRNEPLPREDWDLCAEPDVCRRCAFYELCKPELGGAGPAG